MRWLFAPGRIAILSCLAALVAIGLFIYALSLPPSSGSNEEPLVLYCAEALRVPMEAIAAKFEKETGQRVAINSGASQTLLASMDVSKTGDLYLPADDSFLDIARKKNLIRETIPLATMSAVVVFNSQTKPIATWNDFIDPTHELILANPDAAAIGKLTREALKKANLWEQVEKRNPVFQPKISDVASAVLLNPRGAGIVFDAVADQFPKLKTAKLPELDGIKANVAVAVTSFSKQPTAALRLARFIAAKDRGLPELAKRNYHVVDMADEYVEHPEIVLFGGSMLRPAIEQTIKEFEAREGATVMTTWNGCGILVAEMNAIAGGFDAKNVQAKKSLPDIYFACEPRFMDKVGKYFGPSDVVSSNRLVIGVAKGNPRQIQTLKDLGKDDLKVGIGNENQCAMGDLTKTTFVRTGLYGRIIKNVVKQAPSGDLLITDFRAGALDVIVCYESNVTPYLDDPRVPMDFVPITIGDENRDCTNPLQPVAISKSSRSPQLSRRLLDAFQTPESRTKFEKFGFGWVKK